MGNTITGTISGDRFMPGSNAIGVISGSTVLDPTLTNNDPHWPYVIPGGTLHLRR